VTITNIGFKDVNHHSGEPYTNTDWTASIADGLLTWKADATFAQNANANALRWSTMYNFWFDASTGPEAVLADFGLFKPGGAGDPSSVSVTIQGPSPAPCLGDFTGDAIVDGADLAFLLGAWGANGADLDANGTTDGADMAILLGAWGACP